GQLGFIIKYNEKYLLIDGYLSDSIDRRNSGIPGWVRCYPVPIAPEELDFVDYVFCSHGHNDHADPETLAGIASVNKKAKYIVSEAIVDTLAA
ncbi:MBL fold metallo-hydrolase, partial [Klebsiella pneumoniae]|uniref:MBL fold metallo-hydrolase n=1 Tax=Klebsiella pneumoniae TaxID=573 RepID=UPI00163D5D1B